MVMSAISPRHGPANTPEEIGSSRSVSAPPQLVLTMGDFLELYAPGGFLEGGPLGAKARQHLWTEYQATDGNGAAAGGQLTLDMLDF